MSDLDGTLLRLHEVERAPAAAGVYAWYCKYRLSHADIESVVSEVSVAETVEEKRNAIRNFLDRRIMRRFREAPYSIDIQGALKPRYRGKIEHVEAISESLVTRLVEDPTRLFHISEILRRSVPNMASPIYIGTAANLQKRLRTHVRLIREYGAAERPKWDSGGQTETELRDHSFAAEVSLERRLDPNDLRVYVQPIDLPPDFGYDLENLLNRLNYPLCGRN